MEAVEYLIVGAGVSGLSFANWLLEEGSCDFVVVESESEPGGYCRTIRQDGFVWDYSGHFFHFRYPEIAQWLRKRMLDKEVHTVERKSFVRWNGQDIDYPFQKNIHQLPKEQFLDCLCGLLSCGTHSVGDNGSFRDMLYSRYGEGIAERFLLPYNEKVYACDLTGLDADAMGRFFPRATLKDVLQNIRLPDNAGYNVTFQYPVGGAIEYIEGLLQGLPSAAVCCGERLLSVNLQERVATTSRRKVHYRYLVNSAPLNQFVKICQMEHEPCAFEWSKVLVFNFGV